MAVCAGACFLKKKRKICWSWRCFMWSALNSISSQSVNSRSRVIIWHFESCVSLAFIVIIITEL